MGWEAKGGWGNWPESFLTESEEALNWAEINGRAGVGVGVGVGQMEDCF